jgi:hypothetical protein
MGNLLSAVGLFSQRQADEEKFQSDEAEKARKLAEREALAKKVEEANARIDALLRGDEAVAAGIPDIQAASNGAASQMLKGQYERGDTLTMGDRKSMVDAANAKYPSLGRLAGQGVLSNLSKLKTGSPANISGVSDIARAGYPVPAMPQSTPESAVAGAEGGKAKEAEIRRNFKPDFRRAATQTTSLLSPFMVRTGATAADVPTIGNLEKWAEGQEREELAKNRGVSGGFGGWKQRSDEWDSIGSIPAGPDRDQAIQNYLYKWAPSVGYGASPAAIDQATKKAVAVGSATIPVKAQSQYATTTAAEQAQRDIQKNNPMLTGEGAIKVSQSAMAIKNLQRLKNALEKGDIDYFDIIKKTGQFKNPEVNNAFQQVSEIVGRQQSGAAIANHEWSNFGKEILNRNFLLTEQGKRTALENIDDYLDRFQSVGILQTSDEDWYNKYNERVQRARGGKNQQPQSVTATPGRASQSQDSEAIQWAKQNPNDPRAKKILQLNGM